MAKPLRRQRPFDAKAKGTLKAKALAWMAQARRWQRQRHFTDKGPTMAKASQWQRQRQGQFEGKGHTMAKATMANALRRQRPFDGI